MSNRKNRINLGAISNIDDEIIESATKERVRLLAALSNKNLGRRLVVLLVAAALLLGAVGTTLIMFFGGDDEAPLETKPPILEEKSVPVYEGMSASKNNPKIAEALSLSLDFKPVKPIKDAVRDDYKNKGSLSIGENNELYYGNANEDIYIAIHINNPDNYEILSFTFNGEKYSSYMFEAGSDMQTIVVKKNLGDRKGIIEYTIDAIKYVDGTEIKDVKMEGNRTIRVGVHTDVQPTPTVSNEKVLYDSISFDVIVSDVDGLIAMCKGELYAALYDGKNIVQKQALTVGKSKKVVFDGLMPDTAYQYSIVAVYDSFDGGAINTHVLYENIVKTEALFELITKPDEFSMNFALRVIPGVTMSTTKIELIDSNNSVHEYDGAIRSFRDLSMGKYTMRITYEYQVKGGKKKTAVLSHDFTFIPEESQGLKISNGVIVGIGDCKDELIYINRPVAESAFMGNSQIKAIYIGKNVTSIARGAFVRCSELKEIIFDDDSMLEVISNDAFALCPKLTAIDLPDSLKSLGNTAFAEDTALKNVSLPEKLESIGDLAFSNCVLLEKLYIPKSVVTIGSSVFFGCKALELMVDDENENYSLKDGCLIEHDTKTLILGFDNAVLPTDNSVTKIGYRAFFGCDKLERVSISRHISEIGTEAFRGCTSLVSLSVDEYNDKYYSVGNCIVEKATKTLVVGCDASVLPRDADIAEIAAYAFYNCNGLSSIKLPSSVKKIGNYAFSGCKKLGALTLPSSLEVIGEYAFYGCSSLKLSGAMPSVKTIGQYAFYECSSLESIALPNSTTDLGASAFSYSGLKSVTLGSGITKLQSGVFAGTDITSINIPASVREITGTFNSCDKLSNVTFAPNSELTTIGSGAFDRCASLRSITLPEKLTSIQSGAFSNCAVLEVYNLSNITLNANNSGGVYSPGGVSGGLYNTAKVIHTSASVQSKIKQIGDFIAFVGEAKNYLLGYNGSASSITLPADIEGNSYEIAEYAFAYDDNLTSVNFAPNSKLTVIGGYAFYEATNLKTVGDIPEGVKAIKISAFSNTVIEEIKLPDSLETLEFFGTTNIKSLTIPANVSVLGGFYGGMPYLESLTINSSKLYSLTIYNCSALKTITICDGVKMLNFSTCSNLQEISIPSTVTDIKFSDCISLRSVTFTGEIKSIPSNAFDGCTSLTSITLPSTVESIGENAFRGTSLSSITLPQSLNSIGNGAFADTRITTLAIPERVSSIESKAFEGCDAITSISIGKGVRNVASDAFKGCTAIESILVSVDNTSFCVVSGCLINKDSKELCLATKEALIPSDAELVTSIGAYAFAGRYTARSTVTIPENITSIGEYAFADCTKLTSIVMPNGITEIKAYTFSGCKSLTSVILPSSIFSIGEGAFYYNVKLRQIVLPASLTVIGDEAFYGSELLSEIKFLGTVDQWKNNVVKGVYWDRYVPAIFINCSDKEINV